MYISNNLLKEFVKIPKNLSTDEIASLLNLHTVEVEKIIYLKEQFKNIIVAEVLEVNNHPKADRLKLVKLNTGDEVLEVICGADNVEEKQKVALALAGAILSNGLEIKETEIRGIKSNGMICAEDELGLGEDHEGIIVLDKKAKKGQNLADYFKLDDIIFEIDNKSLSHRGDLWGHYGLARELAAILKAQLKPYSNFIQTVNYKEANDFKVKIINKDLCPRYLAWRVENIKVEESPQWLKNKIIAAGYRPINNIVDASNYVMIESGQPLHTFCGDKIKNIEVRLAKKGESVKTIDEKDRVLSENDLVITSEKQILAIAGIMGSLDSAVNLDSQSIIIESANFDAVTIRKSSQSLGLRTEASARFEKSIDPELAPLAMKRLVTILKDLCPQAEFISKPSDVINYQENKINQIELEFSWLYKRLGKEIDKNEVVSILEPLGFKTEINNDTLLLTIPSWRAVKDVKIKEDILEEVARIYGYNNIEPSLPEVKLKPLLDNHELKLERKIKDFLSKSAAFFEDYNYAFVDEKQLLKMGVDTSLHWRLANPSSQNYTLLRQSLAPNLISSIIFNQHKFKKLSFFEIGRVFFPVEGDYDKEGRKDNLPLQEKKVSLVIAGYENSFSKAKGVIEALIKNLLGNNQEIEFSILENNHQWSDSNWSIDIKLGSENLGYIVKVKKEVADKLNLKLQTTIVEINFSKLLDIYKNISGIKYQQESRFPALERDLAFVIDKKVSYNKLYKAIKDFNPLIVEVDLFDVYLGDKLEKHLKSLAFHISYQSSEKTLSSQEVDNIQNDLVKFLKDNFSAKLRDF